MQSQKSKRHLQLWSLNYVKGVKEMSGYVFLSNSTKPTEEQQNSREKVYLTNVSRPCIQVAMKMGYDVYFGTNRANTESLQCELPVKNVWFTLI